MATLCATSGLRLLAFGVLAGGLLRRACARSRARVCLCICVPRDVPRRRTDERRAPACRPRRCDQASAARPGVGGVTTHSCLVARGCASRTTGAPGSRAAQRPLPRARRPERGRARGLVEPRQGRRDDASRKDRLAFHNDEDITVARGWLACPSLSLSRVPPLRLVLRRRLRRRRLGRAAGATACAARRRRPACRRRPRGLDRERRNALGARVARRRGRDCRRAARPLGARRRQQACVRICADGGRPRAGAAQAFVVV